MCRYLTLHVCMGKCTVSAKVCNKKIIWESGLIAICISYGANWIFLRYFGGAISIHIYSCKRLKKHGKIAGKKHLRVM